MKILLLGLGRANIHVARYLINRGDDVSLYEENAAGLSQAAQELVQKGAIKEYKEERYDLVISSPGFPQKKPIINHLLSLGMNVIDETEFTFEHIENPLVIAVTGTNGKSTTIALISHILTRAGRKNFMGGNIAPGKPFSQALFEENYSYYVLEMSSFQLTRIKKFHARVGVITNISIDHLNWHTNIDEYFAAKKRLFLNQTKDDYAILNVDDYRLRVMGTELCANIIYFGTKAKNGAWFNGDFHFGEEKIFSNHELHLPGEHNQMNIMAAIAVSKVVGVENSVIEQAVRTFKPLPHRLEDLGVINGIRYINNSMTTNEEAAIASFHAIKGNRIVIVGGRAKGDPCLKYLAVLVKEAKGCVIMGENVDDIARYFESNNYHQYKIARDMAEAIRKSRELAAAGDVIMLNPGFASFGHFKDFQERGDAFKNGILAD